MSPSQILGIVLIAPFVLYVIYGAIHFLSIYVNYIVGAYRKRYYDKVVYTVSLPLFIIGLALVLGGK